MRLREPRLDGDGVIWRGVHVVREGRVHAVREGNTVLCRNNGWLGCFFIVISHTVCIATQGVCIATQGVCIATQGVFADLGSVCTLLGNCPL